MTLTTLLSDIPPLATLRGLWLAFPVEMGAALAAAQEGQTKHRAEPVALTDGRLALCADLLSEIGAGGLFAATFAKLNAESFASVDVITQAEFTQLQPPFDEP
jgi:hypothetical protein